MLTFFNADFLASIFMATAIISTVVGLVIEIKTDPADNCGYSFIVLGTAFCFLGGAALALANKTEHPAVVLIVSAVLSTICFVVFAILRIQVRKENRRKITHS